MMKHTHTCGTIVGVAGALTFLVACSTSTHTNKTSTDSLEVYTTVNDPHEAFNVFARTSKTSGSASASTGGEASPRYDADAEHERSIERLAELIDQIGLQSFAGYKAALYGLNANPTNRDNRDQYWRTIRDINQSTATLRDLALRERTKIAIAGTKGFGVDTGNGQRWLAYVSANGGTGTPWVKTGIPIRKGQKIIVASVTGKSNLAFHRMVKSADDDTYPTEPWRDADGTPSITDYDSGSTRADVDAFRKAFRLDPANESGFLLGVISATLPPSKIDLSSVKLLRLGTGGPPPPGSTTSGKQDSYVATEDGELWLAVNDIWLNETMKDVYAPTIARFPEYYQGDSDEAKRQKYESKVAKWNELVVGKGYWSIWYDDNAGGYSVVVDVFSE